jgi:hypothetical protein
VGKATNSGAGVILHEIGGQWTAVSNLPSTGSLAGVAVDPSSGQVWAVGADATISDAGVILHEIGGQWTAVSSLPSTGSLAGVAVDGSRGQVWAVGADVTGGGSTILEFLPTVWLPLQP